MKRRSAVTLIEALMAIFVMAIGLLALLTLFPLGAMSMAQAIKDQRTTETNNIGVSLFKSMQVGNDPVVNGSNPSAGVGQLSWFQDPWPQGVFGPIAPPKLLNGPSYPIYIDPLYLWQDLGNPAVPVLGLPSSTVSGIPRVTLANTNPMNANPLATTRWCTLQDDIYFADNGLPDPSSGSIPREGRYTLAYMVRRASANGADLPLDLTVVVYAGRQPGPNLLAAGRPPIGETTFNNATFGGTATPGLFSDRSILLQWLPGQQAPPKVRRGTWLLDARMTGVTANGTPFLPQGYFYRVTNVSDVGADGFLEVEVQGPNGGALPIGYYTTQQALPLQGPVIVMDNVSEVFARGTNY